MQSRRSAYHSVPSIMSNREDVQVVISGVAGWFPGCSRSLSELGDLLLDNKYLVQEQAGRWSKNVDLGEEPLFGSLGDYGDFDHAFFGMHQKLAYWTDPAARLCIERSFEAIIDAGLSPRELKGSKTNVYVSSTFSDFEALMLDHFEAPSGYAIAGMSRTMIPNRISYFYDLKGQSCGFDGNWPWGELGLQMAQDAIRSGYCNAALVLASSVVHRPERTAQCRPAGLISDDGLCRSFDADASGGQRSDAVVCFVVQRADMAKRCYARVVASRCGVAGPVDAAGDPLAHNPEGIERLLRTFYQDCGEDPEKVAYLEADGSGCKPWEEAELQACGRVLARGRQGHDRPLLVGSVKSNLGHTDGCAGMLAVAKLIVAMETGVIPATINHAKPNPNIEALREGKLKVVTSNTALEVDEDTLLAATTLGLGGTVGHVLVRANPKAKVPTDPTSAAVPRIVTISGRSEDGVLASLKQVQAQPFDPEYLRLVQDAFTDVKGHTVRGFTIAPPLQGHAPVYKVNTSERRPLVLVFSGMGCQWPGMAKDLMALPAFAETIERLHDVLSERGTGLDLKHIVTNDDPSAFDDIMNSFVGITAVQVALTNVLTAAKLTPDLLFGHSLGELACGYADGCLSEKQTILASYVRGRAATEAKLVDGMMAAVGAGYTEMEGRLPPSLDIACHNSSTSCTLAGPTDDVQAFVDELQAEGVFARAVNASNIAFHSRYVRPAAPLVLQGLESVIPEPRARSSRWLSTSVPEARWAEPAASYCSPEYQTNNLLSPVLFEEVLVHVPEDAVVLEIAPHGLLQSIVKRALPDNHHLSLTQRGAPDGEHFLLEAIGGLYSLGLNPLVSALCPEVDFPVSRGTPSLAPLVSWDHVERNTFLDRPLQDCRTTFSTTVTPDSPYMELNGKSFRPVSEMMLDVLAGFSRMSGDKHEGDPITMSEVHVFGLIENPTSGECQINTSFLSASGRFEMTDWSGTLVMSGRVRHPEDDEVVKTSRCTFGPSGPGNGRVLTGEALYEALGANGIAYSLHSLRSVSTGSREWFAETSPQMQAQLASSLQLMQLVSLTDDNAIAVPAVIGRVDFFRGDGDGRLRFDRSTGYMESTCVRLEAVEMRPLTAGLAKEKPQLREVASQWHSPDSLEVRISSIYSEEGGTAGNIQLCGLAGERLGGQRVMAVGLKRAAEKIVRMDTTLVWPVPNAWSDKQAATATLPYCKAEYALRVMARASAGESVLVHEGTSLLGQAAVRVALGIGCTVFTTVRSQEERHLLLSVVPELLPENVLSLSAFEWQLRIRSKKGLDVAVGALTGETLKASLRCMALWGRYVHCAPHQEERNATIGMNKFLESLSLIGVTDDSLLLAGTETQRLVAEAVLEGIVDGTVRPLVLSDDTGETTYSSTEAESTFLPGCMSSMESIFDSGYTSPTESTFDLGRDYKSSTESMSDPGPTESTDVVNAINGEVESRLLSCLPTPRHRRSASASGREGRADGVRLRRLPSRCGRRSCSVTPQSRSQSRTPQAQPQTADRPEGPESREVFPLLALTPLGLPLDAQGAASLRELASRLMMPVMAVEIPWSVALGRDDLAGQARAVVDALKTRDGTGAAYNLLGWGPGTPLALEVAHQLGEASTPTCTFLLDGDVRAVQSWASNLAASPGGVLGELESLRPLLRNLGRRHAVTADPPKAPRGGRVVVLRGSNKEATSLQGQPNVEVRTLQLARLNSKDVANAINSAAAWSRMVKTAKNSGDQ